MKNLQQTPRNQENAKKVTILREWIEEYFKEVLHSVFDINEMEEKIQIMMRRGDDIESCSVDGIWPIHDRMDTYRSWLDEEILLTVTLPITTAQVASGRFWPEDKAEDKDEMAECMTLALCSNDHAVIRARGRNQIPWTTLHGNWIEMLSQASGYMQELHKESGFDITIPSLWDFLMEKAMAS